MLFARCVQRLREHVPAHHAGGVRGCSARPASCGCLMSSTSCARWPQIDQATSFALIKRVIFGSDADPGPGLPLLDDDQAGAAARGDEGPALPGLRAPGPPAAGHGRAARFFAEPTAQVADHAVTNGAASEPPPRIVCAARPAPRVACRAASRAGPTSRARRAHCGTGASSRCPRPHRAAARSSARCGRRARGAAS